MLALLCNILHDIHFFQYNNTNAKPMHGICMTFVTCGHCWASALCSRSTSQRPHLLVMYIVYFIPIFTCISMSFCFKSFFSLPLYFFSKPTRIIIYSVDDKSRRELFCLVGGNTNKNKIYLLAYVGGEKNMKIKADKITQEFQLKWSFLRKKCTVQIDCSNTWRWCKPTCQYHVPLLREEGL